MAKSRFPGHYYLVMKKYHDAIRDGKKAMLFGRPGTLNFKCVLIEEVKTDCVSKNVQRQHPVAE